MSQIRADDKDPFYFYNSLDDEPVGSQPDFLDPTGENSVSGHQDPHHHAGYGGPTSRIGTEDKDSFYSYNSLDDGLAGYHSGFLEKSGVGHHHAGFGGPTSKQTFDILPDPRRLALGVAGLLVSFNPNWPQFSRFSYVLPDFIEMRCLSPDFFLNF